MTNLALGGFFAVFALVTGYGFVSQRKRLGRMADTETTRSDQVMPGTVELKGTVRARETVRDPMHGQAVVSVDWEVSEEETSVDEDGAESHDRQLASGRRDAVFEVEDDGGTVAVDPSGATLKMDSTNRTREQFIGTQPSELVALADETKSDQSGTDREGVSVRSDGVTSRLYNGDSTRIYEHDVLRPGDEVYVLGEAKRRDDELVVVDGGNDMLLSNMTEAELSDTLGSNQWLLAALAVGFTIGAAYFFVLG